LQEGKRFHGDDLLQYGRTRNKGLANLQGRIGQSAVKQYRILGVMQREKHVETGSLIEGTHPSTEKR
jgi:hypothetical protein